MSKPIKMVEITQDDALIIVDMQNDFITGSLAVPDAEAIVPTVKSWIEEAYDREALIIFTRDWHPKNHISFAQWPVHCVQNTKGAELHPEIKELWQQIRWSCFLMNKGTDVDKDSYSAFFEDIAEGNLKIVPTHYLMVEGDIDRVFVCGLATDYCVKATVLDALKLEWPVLVIENAIKAVNLKAGDGAVALNEMVDAGAILI